MWLFRQLFFRLFFIITNPFSMFLRFFLSRIHDHLKDIQINLQHCQWLGFFNCYEMGRKLSIACWGGPWVINLLLLEYLSLTDSLVDSYSFISTSSSYILHMDSWPPARILWPYLLVTSLTSSLSQVLPQFTLWRCHPCHPSSLYFKIPLNYDHKTTLVLTDSELLVCKQGG